MLKVRKGNNLDFEIFEYLISQFYERKTLKGAGAQLERGNNLRQYGTSVRIIVKSNTQGFTIIHFFFK